VARNILVALDPAVDEQGWDRKIPRASGSRKVAVFTGGVRAVGAGTEGATGSRAGATVVIGHTVSKSWELGAGVVASEDKSAVGSGASASPRSAQIRGTVSVQQGSPIRKACLYE
jgi:hypothetical protein